MLAEVIGALSGAGIGTLVFKGAHVAETRYSEPWMRQRADTDLLVVPGDVDAAGRVLAACGFRAAIAAVPADVSGARAFVRVSATGREHEIDLHTSVSGDPEVAALFDVDGLMARSVPLPGLHADARAPADEDAILIAAVHLAGHRTSPYHADGEAMAADRRLIWLRDIWLLLSGLPPGSADRVGDLMRRLRIGPLVAGAQTAAESAFGPTGADLGAVGDAGPAVRQLGLGSGARTVRAAARERSFRRIRAFLLAEPDYLHARYGPGWLPVLRVRRVLDGVLRRLAGR